MKIIGRLEDGYILSATKAEVAHIAGWAHHQTMYESAASAVRHRDRYEFNIGTVIDIGDCWRRFNAFLQSVDARKTAAKTLQSLIDALEIPMPLIDGDKHEPAKAPTVLEID